MRYFIRLVLIIFFPLLAIAKTPPLKPAPLMPLVPGDPLELNLPLRAHFYEKDQSAHNLAVFHSYTIPWIPLIFFILVLSLAPFFLLVLKIMKQTSQATPSFQSLIKQLQDLQQSDLPPKELLFRAAQIFKLNFENGPAMTYQELLESIRQEKNFSEEEISSLKKQFETLALLQYQNQSPSKQQVLLTIENTQKILKTQALGE